MEYLLENMEEYQNKGEWVFDRVVRPTYCDLRHKYANTGRLRSIIFNTNNHSSKIWLSSNQRQELAAAAAMWP